MKSKKRVSIKIVSVVTGGVVAVVFVGGMFWSWRRASDDTEKAVRNVSFLYMNELTDRCEQVVAASLLTYINDMEIALGLLREEHLASVASLRAYQAELKRLYGLETFAFVDTRGTIYTSRGTRTDIDRYQFDYNALASPEISIKESDGNKKVIVAAPVDRLPFNGDTLVACFMEIDMENMLAEFSLQFVNVGITFCTIYTKDGVSFSGTFLDGLGTDGNLLDALEQARFEKGYSLQNMRRDFSEGNEGIALFSYNGIRETMYYKPVRNTDWMVTYLIHESVISDQIGSISNGIITRGYCFSVFAIVVLVALFVGIFMQMQKSTKLMLEKEVADTENRISQEELRKQLALQQEISRQERRRCAQDNMITALASDYRSVYYINLDTDDGVCYRTDGSAAISVGEGDHIPFRQTFLAYADEFVAEEYRQKFLDFIDPVNIRAALHKSPLISIRYLVHYKGKSMYEMLRMAGVRKEEDRIDGKITLIGVGFSDIDEEMRESLARNQALSDALKMAEEASKAKTAFLSSMSHEIRTPMNAIIGLDTIALKNEHLSAETRGHLEKIGVSARHLLSLINDILDMSRIESGRMVLKNEEFSFRLFLDQINTIVDSQCRDKNLRYDCTVMTKIDEHYIGDAMKLKQVLINILGNAIKFTPSPGTVSLAIACTAQFEHQTTLRFVISDTGIGMDKEFLPRIFDAFAQEDSTTTSKYGGSGLGMAITKNILDLMNGNITVESEKGKGSTFTVTVTLLNTEQKAGTAPRDVNPADLKVLVIDDDEIACAHARIVLEEIGVAVDTCMDGTAALQLIQNQVARHEPYNLVIVDYQMPGADGVELTRRIRGIVGQETTVIILTAYHWTGIEAEAKAAGVDSFMSKPLFASSVMNECTAVVQKKHLGIAAAEAPAVDLHGRRILLAEDMQINMEIMKELLDMEGMEVEHAENGQIAVDMFKASEPGHFDAVLMDVRMPVMDGLKATATIRALDHPDAQDIPIIALTANAFDEDVQHSLQAGMTAHLTKPVEPEKLYRSLAELIGARPVR